MRTLVLREGLVLGCVGVAVGLAGALLLTRSLEGLLFDVSRFDAVTFAGMAIALSAITLAACWIPARRATSVDPLRALRYE